MSTVTKKKKKLLYLVLHGEMVIVDDPADSSNLTILIPNVPGHVVMAGPWLGERKLFQGDSLQPSAGWMGKTIADGADSPFNYPQYFIGIENAPPKTLLGHSVLHYSHSKADQSPPGRKVPKRQDQRGSYNKKA